MPGTLPKTLAAMRIAVGLLFIIFGQFKVMGDEFVPGMVRGYVQQAVEENRAVGFYQVFLEKAVLPNVELFGYLVGWGELLIGMALVIGLWVRAASALGGLHMLNLTLASWHAPGADAPLWQYFAAQLEHLPLLLLFVIFFVGRAGEVWGLDSRLRRPSKPK